MLRTTKIIVIVVLTILLVSVALGTLGNGGSHGNGGFGGKGSCELRFGERRGGFWSKLTEEQREIVKQTIREMRENDATREEIREAVAELLEGWGIEMPEPHRPPFWDQLTEEQREIVKQTIKEMRENDATREEIREAVAELLEGWGIEMPEPHRPPFWEQLTEEQREIVKQTIREMRENEATREEIREAVAELLEGWGIEQGKDGEGRVSDVNESDKDVFLKPQEVYLTVSPNPFNSSCRISAPQGAKVEIYNVKGQLVETSYITSTFWLWQPDENTESGTYLIKATFGDKTITKQLVYLK